MKLRQFPHPRVRLSPCHRWLPVIPREPLDNATEYARRALEGGIRLNNELSIDKVRLPVVSARVRSLCPFQ